MIEAGVRSLTLLYGTRKVIRVLELLNAHLMIRSILISMNLKIRCDRMGAW